MAIHPHGIRLAIEYAMRENLYACCLHIYLCSRCKPSHPIPYCDKYLPRYGTHQSSGFSQLIGRAGRSGMHTEGSILFADPSIYDTKKKFNENWRWNGVKELLDPANAEDCTSSLLPTDSSDYSQ